MLKLSLYFIVLLILQEILFRVCFPIPELSNFDRGFYTEKDEKLAKGYVRNRSYYWESSVDTSHKFVHHYNRYGFRDKEWKVEKGADKPRVLFIGDSYVESVMSDSTMTEYFHNMANSDAVEVMNAGMLGIGFTRYLRLLTDMVPIFRPDVVVMVVYANDFMDDKITVPTNYATPIYYEWWKPRVVELLEQWKRGTPVPFRWGVEAKPLFAKAGENGFVWNGALDKMEVHAEPFLADAMKAGTFNHHRLNEIKREALYLKKQHDLRLPMDYFRFYAAKFQFEPLVVYIPSRNQITDHYLQYEFQLCKTCDSRLSLTDSIYNQNQVQLEKVCADYNLPFVNLSNVIRAEENRGNHLYWNYDGHLNEKGTELVAEEIYQFFVHTGQD
ncbi:MAG: hypothetical protein GC178_01750 [Flavobacteriales bacterium]|nr:hypothetical protein [Flavobacteriales bacterium]